LLPTIVANKLHNSPSLNAQQSQGEHEQKLLRLLTKTDILDRRLPNDPPNRWGGGIAAGVFLKQNT